MRTYSLANPLQKGDDLKPLQKALKAAHFYGGKIDGVFGAGMGDACKRAKFALGYPLKACLPTGGQTLLDYLNGTVGLPAAYRLRRQVRGFGLSKEERRRIAIVAWAHWGVKHEPEIHYTEGPQRDDFLLYHAGALPMNTDCSGFVTACYKWAGAPDPSGFGYRVVGYTGTLLDHGVTIPLAQAKPGDLVIWGSYPGHHTAVIVDVKKPADPMIVSHGFEGGPNLELLSAETAAQRRSYVVKRYSLV